MQQRICADSELLGDDHRWTDVANRVPASPAEGAQRVEDHGEIYCLLEEGSGDRR
jgi:hypothetical protein